MAITMATPKTQIKHKTSQIHKNESLHRLCKNYLVAVGKNNTILIITIIIIIPQFSNISLLILRILARLNMQPAWREREIDEKSI